jgi:hypothetical protein
VARPGAQLRSGAGCADGGGVDFILPPPLAGEGWGGGLAPSPRRGVGPLPSPPPQAGEGTRRKLCGVLGPACSPED